MAAWVRRPGRVHSEMPGDRVVAVEVNRPKARGMEMNVFQKIIRVFRRSGPDLQICIPNRICKPDQGAADGGIAANPVRNREPGTVDYSSRSEELGDSGLRAGSYDPSSADAKPTRFERRMDAALHPRQRRHHAKRKNVVVQHPQTRVQALLEDIAAEPEVNTPDYSPFQYPRQHLWQMCDAGGEVAKVGVALAVASVADGVEAVVDKVRELAMREQREKELAKRRKYYATEHEKYRREVEKIRTATLPPENPMPTPEELLAAYVHRHDSEEAKLRFGRLMIDLDEHVRYEVRMSDGRISGTDGGVRDWLVRNCPELAKHYHTCQRFKRKVQEDAAAPCSFR